MMVTVGMGHGTGEAAPAERDTGAQKPPSPKKGHKQVTELKLLCPDLAKASATRRATIRREGS